MNLTFYGAVGGVTGTSYYCTTGKSAILIDCGLFQGGQEMENMNKLPPPVDYKTLDAIILTHAHLDHCGRLPLVVQTGYRNPVFATPATIDLVALVLRDALKIQMADIEKKNRTLERLGKKKLQPAYSSLDVETVISLLRPVPYHESFSITPDLSVTISEAGHILGSGTILLTEKKSKNIIKVVFSGDLGTKGMPIVRDPEPFSEADAVVLESTYGDRDHKPIEETLNETIEIIKQAILQKGKIIVPSFAIGRTQDLIYYLEQAFRKGGLPRFPVFVDSPMATEASRIYMEHPELYDSEMMESVSSGQVDLLNGLIHQVSTPEESRSLNEISGPAMIIAGSGMCTAGRILHHLRHNLWKPETSVLIVGYQAEGTLGRQLVEGATSVRIFGEKIAVRAKIHKLGGFSAHAGQTDLLKWFNSIAQERPGVILTHGETTAREELGKIILHRYGIKPILPNYGDSIQVKKRY